MIDKNPIYRVPRRFADFMGFDVETLTNFSPEVESTEVIQSTTENYIAVMELGHCSIRQCLTGEV